MSLVSLPIVLDDGLVCAHLQKERRILFGNVPPILDPLRRRTMELQCHNAKEITCLFFVLNAITT